MSSPHGAGRAFIRFEALDTPFVAPLHYVRSAVKLGAVTPVPLAPAHVLGLMNLRGEIAAVICWERLLDPRARPEAKVGLALALEGEDDTFVLAVSDPREVVVVDEEHILPVPRDLDRRRAAFVSGVARLADTLALIVDPAKIPELGPTKIAA